MDASSEETSSSEELPATSNLQVSPHHREDSGYLSGSLSTNQCSIFSEGGSYIITTPIIYNESSELNKAQTPCVSAEGRNNTCDTSNGMDVDDFASFSLNTPNPQMELSSCCPAPYTCQLPKAWQSTPALEGTCITVQQEFDFVTPLPARDKTVTKAPSSGLSFYSASVGMCQNSLAGQDHVDILSLLAEHDGPPLMNILNYLEPVDLCQVRLVSKSWRKMLQNSPHVKLWRHFVIHRRQNKENSKLTAVKPEEVQEILFSPITSRSQLKEIHNVVRVSKKQLPRSPPVSPSKTRSSRFVKEGQKLRRGQKLLKCPKCCEWPARCEANRAARCTGGQCQFYFCIDCSSPFHENSSCPKTTPVTPTRTKKGVIKLGSKISKRNLQRLLI